MKKILNKKVLGVLLAVMMLLVMSAPAFATDNGYVLGDETTAPTYSSINLVSNPSGATEATVTVIFETADSYEEEYGTDGFFEVFDVTLSSNSAKVFSVQDLLWKIHSDSSYHYSFLTRATGTYFNDEFEDDSLFLAGVERTDLGEVYETGYFDTAGWSFRVNDQLPVVYDPISGTYYGADLEQAKIENGDIIHFFWDEPAVFFDPDSVDNEYAYSTEYINIVPTVTQNNNNTYTVSAVLQSHVVKMKTINYSAKLCVYDYSNFAHQGVTVYLCDPDNYDIDDLENTAIDSATTNASGAVSFTSLPGDTDYILITERVIFYDNDEPMDYSGFLLDQTTGYCPVST